MADETAYFEFGTNAETVAASIVAAMGQINGALSTPLETPHLQDNIGQLGGLFEALDRQFQQARARIQEQMSSLGAGAVPRSFLGNIKEGLRSDLAEISTIFGQEMAKVSDVAATSTPVSDLARRAGESYIQRMVAEMQAMRPELAAAGVTGIPWSKLGEGYKTALGDLQANPAAYASDQLSVIERLTNYVRAERLVAQNPTGPGQLEHTLGMTGLTNQIRAQAEAEGRLYETEQGGVVFKPSDAQQRLNTIVQLRREAEAAALRQERVNAQITREEEKQAQILREQVALEAQKNLIWAAQEYNLPGLKPTRSGARSFGPLGGAYRDTEAGITPLGEGRLEAAYTARDARIRSETRLINEEAQAVEVLDEKWQKANNGVYVSPDQTRFARKTTTGATEDVGKIQQAEALDYLQKVQAHQEITNRLVENWKDVIPVAQYRVLGDEVIEINAGLRQQVTDQVTINEILAKRDAILASQVAQQERADALAQHQTAKAALGSGGFMTGFLNRWYRGESSPLTNMGTQVAQSAGYMLSYGALFGVLGTLKNINSQFLDYQDSMTDLQVAERNTGAVTNDFTNQLGELARVSGDNLGSALDTAARAIRAFGDPAGNTAAQLQAIGENANEAATKMALISSQSLPDATGNVIAVGTAFGMRPDQLNQITDAVANAKRTLGGNPQQISQGLAYIGSAAKKAGYDLNEAAAVMSLVQARTDESGQAIATRLSRVFQIVSGSTGKALAAELGVNPNESAKKQIEQYAALYTSPNTSQAVKDRISSALGGTANLRELLPLLQEQNRLTNAYAEANKNAGQGASEFARQSDNLVGTLKKIRGDISAIEVNLARSDLFAPFGAAVQVLEPALHALDRLLQLLQSVPSAARAAVFSFADLAAAATVVGMVQKRRATIDEIKNGGAKVVGSDEEKVAREAQVAMVDESTAEEKAARARLVATLDEGNAAIAAADAERVAVTEAANVPAGMVGMQTLSGMSYLPVNAGEAAAAEEAAAAAKGAWWRGALATGAATLPGQGLKAIGGMLLNPWTLGIGAAVGGLALYDNVATGLDQRTSFLNTYASTSEAYKAVDGSAASLQAAAHDLHAAAGDIKRQDANWVSKGVQQALAGQLNHESVQTQAIARQVAAEQSQYARAQDTSVFGNGGVITTVEQLANGLNAMTSAGQTAVTQLHLVRRALENTATPQSGKIYQPQGFSSEVGSKVIGSILGAIGKNGIDLTKASLGHTQVSPLQAQTGNLGQGALMEHVTSSLADQMLRGAQNQQAIDAAVRSKAEELGLKPGDVISPKQQKELAQVAVDALNLKSLGKNAQEIRQKIYQGLLQSMGLVGKNGEPIAQPDQLLNGKGALSIGQVVSILSPNQSGTWKGLDAMHQQALQAVPASDDGRMLNQVNREYLTTLQELKRRLGNQDLPALDLLIQNAQDAYAKSAFDRLEMLRRHAQNQRGLSKSKIRDIGREYLEREIKAAGDDTAMLIKIMDNADQASLKIVLQHLKDLGYLTQQADYNRRQAQSATSGSIFLPGEGAPPPELSNPGQAIYDAQHENNSPRHKSPYSTGSDTANYKSPSSSSSTDHLSAAQKAALYEQAMTNPDDTIAQATASLHVAEANLAKAKSSTQDWYSAQQAVTQARDQYAKAVAAHAGAIAQANAAKDNGPIAQAQAQIASATATLHATEKGTTAYYQALASFYQAQWQMRDAVIQYHNTLRELNSDFTDPVVEARNALKTAEEKLRKDARAGAGKDTRASDQLAVEQARAQAQSAAFNQRFQDAQTAEQLGQMSFQAYMRYLQHEHDRLTAVHHRTRQQQDELNQIDQAMQQAVSAMDSQFNLGSVNVNGLVYQARRYAAEQKAKIDSHLANQVDASSHRAALAGGSGWAQQIILNINGADVAKVRKVVEDYVGKPNRVLTTQPRRR